MSERDLRPVAASLDLNKLDLVALGLAEDARLIVAGDTTQELAGLALHPTEDAIIGAVPGTPAAELGIEECARLTGLPIAEEHIRRRQEVVADRERDRYRTADSRSRDAAIRAVLNDDAAAGKLRADLHRIRRGELTPAEAARRNAAKSEKRA